MYRNNDIILTMCIQILNAISANDAFKVELFPLKPSVPVGSALELNCRVKDCAGDASFSWSALGDNSRGGYVKDNHTVSRLIFSNILPKHSNTIVCKAYCLRKPRQKTSVVQVYSFPTAPQLARIKHFKANKVQMLSCTIHNIYPSENVKIEWIRGDETFHEEVPDKYDYENVQNFSSTFDYTPSVTDLGKNISCRATLNLTDFNMGVLSKTTTLEYGPGTIIVSSNSSIVQLGEHLEITCHADGNPQPKILWWKIGVINPIAEGQNEKLVINNASWSQAGLYECEARNEVGSLRWPVKIQVPPKSPKIQLEDGVDPSEGDNITILCSSESGPTTLKLSGKNQVVEVLNGLSVFLNLLSVTTADAGVYVCEAKNDFGVKRSIIKIKVKGELTDISTTPDLPTVIVPAVGSVSLLTAIAVLIRYIRKIRRYSVNIPMN
ncbi:vascular cell adhesion protein 1-like [Paramisgurnus dabryanus]|uniref:vascular cell adhesion protein 1-like n=1 Tax=Paramisgurnus dabryanus TaxID=90735 RepID=UPI003CCF59CC